MTKTAIALVTLCASVIACSGPFVPGRGEVAVGTGGQAALPGTGGIDMSASGGATPLGTGGMAAGGSNTTGSGGVSSGTGAVSGSGGAGGTLGGSGGAAPVAADGLPCDVATLVQNRCASCHGATPLPTLPSLVTYQGLTAPAQSDPTMTYAEVAVARMQSTQSPMPPAGSPAATPTELAAMQTWIAGGYPRGSCGGGGGAGGSAPDPFSVPPTCTSNKTWTGGTDGSKDMQPGAACIACHSSKGGGEAPMFAVAGTVYPTAHEPDECYGASGSSGMRVVITGADGKVLTLTPGSSGNFSYQGSLATPYTAKVTDSNGERAMGAAQTSGDCNACHTQSGTNSAPGRIIVP